MEVLIVARTRLTEGFRCLGALTATNRPVRLLNARGHYFKATAPFQIGEVWDMEFKDHPGIEVPHVEDVDIVGPWIRSGAISDLRSHLLGRVHPWRGGPGALFDGLVRCRKHHGSFVSRRAGLPSYSTGFWVPNRALDLLADGKHFQYLTDKFDFRFAYVGEPPAIKQLAAGSLVRMSLARFWKPPDAGPEQEERCYVQISGWY